jgi:type IX secretion system PorP/SprF family membrane protein
MSKKNYYILASLFILLHSNGNAQSLPMYSQYMYNMTNINPAYAGNRGVPSLALIWREQWAGLPGSPSTKSITYDVPNEDKRIGFGIQIFDDRYVNVLRRTGMNMYYNLKFPISEKGVLSMGLKGGFYNDLKLLSEVNTGPVSSYDMAYSSNFNKVVPLAGAGIYYNDDKFYMGFSVPDVILFSNVTNYKSDSNLSQVNSIHYFFTAGYSYNVNEDITLKPSFLVKAVSGAPLELDLNTNLWLKNIVGLGFSYRTSESVLAMAELQITPQFRFGYSYDMPFKLPNSNELFLRVEVGRLFPNTKNFKIY